MAEISKHGLILVETTFARQADAKQMAATLIGQRLAACARVSGPVHSTYRWQGGLHEEEEYLLSVKTLATRYPEISAFVDEHHPYELPEIVATPICRVSDAYFEWATQQCTK